MTLWAIGQWCAELKLNKNFRVIYLEGIASKVDEVSQERWRAYSPNIIESKNWNNDLFCTVSSVFPKLSNRLLLRDYSGITNQILKSFVWTFKTLGYFKFTWGHHQHLTVKSYIQNSYSLQNQGDVSILVFFSIGTVKLSTCCAFKWLVSHIWLWPTWPCRYLILQFLVNCYHVSFSDNNNTNSNN